MIILSEISDYASESTTLEIIVPLSQWFPDYILIIMIIGNHNLNDLIIVLKD